VIQPAAAAALDAILDGAGSTLLLVVDERLRVVRAGRGAAALAERPGDALIGMSLIAAFGSATLDGVAREALASGEPATGETSMGRLGSRSFAIEAVPLTGDGAVIALHETTSQRRAERVRRDFIANISHELRTPLASIKLLAETLSGGAVDDADTAHDFTLQIEREVDHLAQMVDELLDLSMIESGETQLTLEPVVPVEVVHELADRIRPVAERRGVSVRSIDGGGKELAAADRNRLGQALLNLAHNAVKYSRPGGEIRLGAGAHERFVRFTVADDGIGIPAAHQERIFERFYKVDRSRIREGSDETNTGSAGLGLAIVRHIAEAHGGRVGVESTEGAGSTFWIEVPQA
jgi:two-component system phosphate regulon sensor histidine kinase PhoR